MSGAVKPKLCPAHEVEAIRRRLRADGVTDGRLAGVLGISRTHLNQMLNHKVPMRVLYRYAILAVMVELRKRRPRSGPSGGYSKTKPLD